MERERHTKERDIQMERDRQNMFDRNKKQRQTRLSGGEKLS